MRMLEINPVAPTEAHPYLYVGCNPINYTDPTVCAGMGEYPVIAGDGITAVATAKITLGTSLASFGGGVLTGLGCAFEADGR
jgi:hypothetical protein